MRVREGIFEERGNRRLRRVIGCPGETEQGSFSDAS